MVAFFIIPVSLSFTEIVIILFLIALLYIVRKYPEVLSAVNRVVRNIKDVLKED